MQINKNLFISTILFFLSFSFTYLSSSAQEVSLDLTKKEKQYLEKIFKTPEKRDSFLKKILDAVSFAGKNNTTLTSTQNKNDDFLSKILGNNLFPSSAFIPSQLRPQSNIAQPSFIPPSQPQSNPLVFSQIPNSSLPPISLPRDQKNLDEPQFITRPPGLSRTSFTGRDFPESAGQTQSSDASVSCAGKKIIVVGFRGNREVTGGRNPSPGVDEAVGSGCIFEKDAVNEAVDACVLRKLGPSGNNTGLVIVGHSAGANKAIRYANYVVSKYNVVSLIVADPNQGSASSINQKLENVTIGLIGEINNSGQPSVYKGVKLNVGKTIPFADKNHFQVDRLIKNYIPCQGGQDKKDVPTS